MTSIVAINTEDEWNDKILTKETIEEKNDEEKNDEETDDITHCKPLNQFPSFVNMDEKNKINTYQIYLDIKNKSIAEQWFIDFSELKIEATPFANGSCGNVYYCKWRGTNIVVKNILNQKLKDFLCFMNEIKVLSSLRHPNLSQFLGMSISQDGKCYMLLEKIEGISLKKYITESTVSRVTKLKIIQQISLAINFLHQCKPPVIFRDLKPDNIMINKKNHHITLLDFGLSRFLPISNNNNLDTTFELTGETGTFRYMAPEVYKCLPYNLSADIYGLGLLIFFVYSQEIPFQQYSLNELNVYMNKSDMLYSTSNIKCKKIRQIINLCLQKNPILRPKSDYILNYIDSLIQNNSNNENKCNLM